MARHLPERDNETSTARRDPKPPVDPTHVASDADRDFLPRVHACSDSRRWSEQDKGEPEPRGPFLIGRTVGDIYRISRLLGSGGQAVVYFAQDAANHQQVAVKVPRGQFLSDAQAQRDFLHESVAWRRLVHPHIVAVLDVRDDRTTDYLPVVVMDYCSGGSLAGHCNPSQLLSLPDALDVGLQVAWAMEYAHEQGFLHRDLKPANVLLTKDGKALVSDFGLARRFEVEELDMDGGTLQSADSPPPTGSVMGVAGTPEYMAPEQWDGQPCPQSDVYAFGVTLYELCCGLLPYVVQTRAQLPKFHREVTPPSPQREQARLPDNVVDLIMSCIAKSPAERPPNFGAIIEELNGCYAGLADEAHQLRRAKLTAGQLTRHEQLRSARSLLRVGCGCQLRGQVQEAMQHYIKAEEIFLRFGDTVGLAASLYKKGSVARHEGRLDDALELFEEAERIYHEQDSKHLVCECRTDKASILFATGQWDEAMAIHKEVEAICRDAKGEFALERSVGNQAWILKERGQLREALAMYEEAASMCREHGDWEGLQGRLSDQAMVLMNLDELDEADHLLTEQEELCRRFGFKKGLSCCLNNRALILMKDKERPEEALTRLEEAERIDRELRHKHGLQTSLGNKAVVFYEQGKWEDALSAHSEEEQICRDLRDPDALQRCLGEKALVLERLGQRKDALTLLEEKARICRELGNTPSLAIALANQAFIVGRMGNPQQASTLGQEALQLVQGLGMIELERQIKAIVE